ncbi:MAG: ABC transporter substrate-binding protein [Chloroflexota bacterium]
MALGRRSFPVIVALTVGLMACSPPMAATPTTAPSKPADTAKPAANASPAAEKPAAAGSPATAASPAAKPAASGAATSSGAMEPALASVAQQFYDQAKVEGKLIIYGAGDREQFDPARTAFMQRFPGIEVDGVDQRGRESREKVFAEQRGRNYVADIVQSGFTTQNELIEAGFVEPYKSVQVDQIIPELATAAGSLNSRTMSVFSIMVNTNLVPPDQEPKSWNDVLDPKWRGKIAMDDPRGSGPGGTILSPMELLYGLDWSQKLAEQRPFFATQAGPLVVGTVRGEYALFLSASAPDIINQRKAGAPVKQVRPIEGIGITQNSMALIKNAPHSNAAKLWIEWNLSEEGQKVLAASGQAPVRKAVPGAEPEATLGSTKILPRDDTPEAVAALGDRVKRWQDTLFK